MDNNNTEYINIQSGGMDFGFKRLYQANQFRECPGPKINEYLGLDKEITPVQEFYYHFIVSSKTLRQEQIEEISNEINNALDKLNLLNNFIHKYLNNSSKVTSVPKILNFSPENAYESYTILCNLYKNNLLYIKDTDKINILLCKLSIAENYFIDYGVNSLYSENKELLESLENLRLGEKNLRLREKNSIYVKTIQEFIDNNSAYIKTLIKDQLEIKEETKAFEIYNFLIKVANSFNKFIETNKTNKLADSYIEKIKEYYLLLNKDTYFDNDNFVLNLQDLFLKNNLELVKEIFPHLINILNEQQSGSNKFFTLYNYVNNFYEKSEAEQNAELEVLQEIDTVYKALIVYKPKLEKHEFYPKIFSNQNHDLNEFFVDSSLEEIFKYLELPTNNLNDLVMKLNSNEIFLKENINLSYKKYLENFKVPEGNIKTYLDPKYLKFPEIRAKYPTFIINLVNGKLTVNDLPNNLEKFVNYVNTFRTDQIKTEDLESLFLKLYIQVITPEEQKKVNNFVLYNKSLNNKFPSGLTDFTNINYDKLLQILSKIDLEYLAKFNNPEFAHLKTNSDLSFNSIPKSLLDQCVVDKTINKDKISGIKLLIHIVDCKTAAENKDKNKLIHFYLTLNTKETNSSRLISWKKLKPILDKLSLGTCPPKQIYTLIQVIELKKIIDPFLLTELNLLKTTPTDKQQKSLYYLLAALSPEKINWNIMSLIRGYLYDKGMPHVLNLLPTSSYLGWATEKIVGKKEPISISGFKNYVFEKIKVENFVKEDDNSDSQYKFTCFKIYSYFNFDSLIVSIKTIEKIVKQLNLNKYNKKIFDTLKNIIVRNNFNLKEVNKSSSDKLNFFLEKKWEKLKTDPYYISQLYDILKEVADENLFPVNVLDFLKEKGIDVLYDDKINPIKPETDQKSLRELYAEVPENKAEVQVLEEQYEPIYKMFEAFVEENISKQKKQVLQTLDNMKHGICEDITTCKSNIIINLINEAEYLKSNEQIKIFFATGKSSDMTYASEQELYSILESLSKSSALVKNVTAQVTEAATDAITSTVNAKLQSTALAMGFTEVPVDAIAKAKEIAETAKTVAITAGIGFATAGAYLAVDKLLGSDSTNESSSLALYEENDFKSKLKLFIGSVGTGLTIYTARSLFPKISSLAQDYISYKSTSSNLPIPSISTAIIGTIIMTGLTQFLSKTQEGGDDNSNKSKSLIERILDWIFNEIDKLYGFNGKKPEPKKEEPNIIPNKKVESVYVYLTSQKLGSDDIFNSAILNEHPDQISILNKLKRKYRDFNRLSLDSNPYVQLAKQDQRKIKKIIGKIVALELNLFKGNQPYTFVNAISKFLNEK